MSERENWDLTECMAQLRAFRDVRDWARFHRPKELATALAIEVAELQELLLWKDDSEASAALRDPKTRARLLDELADVFTYALFLADRLDADLPDCIQSKLRRNELRYDVENHRSVAKKADERRDLDASRGDAAG